MTAARLDDLTVTLTPGRTAPLESLATPVIVPVVSCAAALAADAEHQQQDRQRADEAHVSGVFKFTVTSQFR